MVIVMGESRDPPPIKAPTWPRPLLCETQWATQHLVGVADALPNDDLQLLATPLASTAAPVSASVWTRSLLLAIWSTMASISRKAGSGPSVWGYLETLAFVGNEERTLRRRERPRHVTQPCRDLTTQHVEHHGAPAVGTKDLACPDDLACGDSLPHRVFPCPSSRRLPVPQHDIARPKSSSCRRQALRAPSCINDGLRTRLKHPPRRPT